MGLGVWEPTARQDADEPARVGSVDDPAFLRRRQTFLLGVNEAVTRLRCGFEPCGASVSARWPAPSKLRALVSLLGNVTFDCADLSPFPRVGFFGKRAGE